MVGGDRPAVPLLVVERTSDAVTDHARQWSTPCSAAAHHGRGQSDKRWF